MICFYSRTGEGCITLLIQFRTVLLTALLVLLAPLSVIAAVDETSVTLIEVQGNRRIETATIIAKIKTREGSVFSPAQIKEDIRTLYQLGHFEDVQVKTEGFEKGLKVIIWVKEKPLIREITYEGNTEVTAESMKEIVTLLPRTAFNQQLVQDNAEKIRIKYQDKGYYHAIVVPMVVEQRGGDKNIVFYIEEGENIKLSDVVLTGNKAIPAEDIKSIMKNQEYWLFSWAGTSGTLRSEDLKEDLETIRNLYYNHGYIQVQVNDPVIEEHPYTEHAYEFMGQPDTYVTKNEVVLRIHIQEGDQFNVGSVTLKGNVSITSDDLLSELKLRRGTIFSREVLRQDVTRIMDRYDAIARPFASVVPLFDIDQAKKTVAITIEIQEGGEVRIGRIDITGNNKSRDKVIRREMRLDEGDLYSKKALKRSYERINNLNFFEVVDIAPERRLQEPVMDLNVKVKEKMTGTLSLGGGYSSVDKLMATAEITQGNFLGRGQMLKFKVQWGHTRRLYMLSFMEPYLFDKPIWGRIDLYEQDQNYDGYRLKTNGFGLGIGKSYSEYVSASMRYSMDVSDVYSITHAPSYTLQKQLDSYGSVIQTNSMTATLTRDSRDFYLDPKTGSKNTVFVQYAGGVFGGNPNFVKSVGDSAWYYPLFLDTVIMARGRAGYAKTLNDLPLPTGDKFFVGGAGSVRGYRYGTVGPMETAPDGSVMRVGGSKELIFNVEYNFPIVPAARLKGLLFYDMGKAFSDSEQVSIGELRRSYGWGFWWLSPMGPLRFEWGYIIGRQPTDQRSAFEFSIGATF
jgi:outer membrane protein insertion porin family